MAKKSNVSVNCYLCGRDKDELRVFIDQQINEIETQIIDLNNNMDKLKKEYDESIKETLKSAREYNLHDISISTILNDPDAFSKKIPHLDIVLDHFNLRKHRFSIDFYGGKKDFNDTLEKLCNKFENTIESNPEIIKISKDIEDFRNRKKRLSELHPFTKEIRIEKAQLTISICPICSYLFDEASDAAWEVLDDD